MVKSSKSKTDEKREADRAVEEALNIGFSNWGLLQKSPDQEPKVEEDLPDNREKDTYGQKAMAEKPYGQKAIGQNAIGPNGQVGQKAMAEKPNGPNSPMAKWPNPEFLDFFKTLGSAAKFGLYMTLAACVTDGKGEVSLSQLCKGLNINRRSIGRQLKSLAEDGLIDLESRTNCVYIDLTICKDFKAFISSSSFLIKKESTTTQTYEAYGQKTMAEKPYGQKAIGQNFTNISEDERKNENAISSIEAISQRGAKKRVARILYLACLVVKQNPENISPLVLSFFTTVEKVTNYTTMVALALKHLPKAKNIDNYFYSLQTKLNNGEFNISISPLDKRKAETMEKNTEIIQNTKQIGIEVSFNEFIEAAQFFNMVIPKDLDKANEYLTRKKSEIAQFVNDAVRY